MWDPDQYAVYADERSRAFADLVARVRAGAPARVVDLGCGDGTLTTTLRRRWPRASIVGVDSSAEMLDRSAGLVAGSRLRFQLGAIEGWTPDQPVDVLISNAALQWVPGHERLLPRFVSALAPGGELAFQVPGNFGQPSHTILAELRESPRWRDRLGSANDRPPASLDPADYLDRLASMGCQVDAWETTYLHVLTGPDPVLDWMRGTGLRPVLAALAADPSGLQGFLAEYGQRLRTAYPAAEYGTVLPYRRIFVVARR